MLVPLVHPQAGPEGRGVRVEMVFRSNPFFHDEVLFREVRGGMDADILLEMLSFAGGHGSAGGAKDAGKEKSTVSGIRWKHGQDLTVLSKRNSGSRYINSPIIVGFRCLGTKP